MLRIERAESQEMLERERQLARIDAHLVVRGPCPVGRGPMRSPRGSKPTFSWWARPVMLSSGAS
jgi:hypothetical protein